MASAFAPLSRPEIPPRVSTRISGIRGSRTIGSIARMCCSRGSRGIRWSRGSATRISRGSTGRISRGSRGSRGSPQLEPAR